MSSSPLVLVFSMVLLSVAVFFRLSVALPPFEIRSGSRIKSEAAEEWIADLHRSKVCQLSTPEAPTFLCHSTKSAPRPQCVYASELCDGHADCPEAEDETTVLCSLRQ